MFIIWMASTQANQSKLQMAKNKVQKKKAKTNNNENICFDHFI